MDPKRQLVCYLIAFACFVVAALWDTFPAENRHWRHLNLVAAGLAAFTMVFLVTAWKAV